MGKMEDFGLVKKRLLDGCHDGLVDLISETIGWAEQLSKTRLIDPEGLSISWLWSHVPGKVALSIDLHEAPLDETLCSEIWNPTIDIEKDVLEHLLGEPPGTHPKKELEGWATYLESVAVKLRDAAKDGY